MSAQSTLQSTPQSTHQSAALAPLREELLLHEAPRTHDGAPSWTLEDPGRALFFQIGWVEAEMLARWRSGNAQRIAQDINTSTPMRLSVQDVQDFAQFLLHNSLLQTRGPQAIARYRRQAQARRAGHWLKGLIHHYLFFRIALWRPDAFLTRTLPWVRAHCYTRRFALLTLVAGLLGLFLAARRWDEFVHTFLHFFTLEGALVAALVLIVTKTLHELGHAYTAKYHGCRVASMGVAFMVLWPVLYTDASGAWRLNSRGPRMAIGAAGMIAETALAAWATLAWSFLPDGMLRSAAFTLATTTWLLTLAVNLNPLMRFDGYFLLADALNVPNLQNRAFALARWRLREWLFDLGEARPEIFAPWRERALLVYAFCVWVYRFFLFLGIALLVYHMAFKLLGIVLFIIEIVAFVLRPIYNELCAWRERLISQQQVGWNRRSRVTAVVFLTIVAALIMPWHTRVEAPALLRAAQQIRLLAPAGVRIDRIPVHTGEQVESGTALFTLYAPELEHERNGLAQHIELLQWQQSFHALRQDSAAAVPVAQREWQAALERYALLTRQQEQLIIRAPFTGIVAEMAEPLSEGEWVGEGEWLATLVAPQQSVVEAYVAEEDMQRLAVGAPARFLPEDPGLAAIPVRVTSIAATATRHLGAVPELASPHGGRLAAVHAPAQRQRSEGDAETLTPEQAVYRMLLHAQDEQGLPRLQTLRGTVVITAERASLLARAWRRAAAVLIRESGF